MVAKIDLVLSVWHVAATICHIVNFVIAIRLGILVDNVSLHLGTGVWALPEIFSNFPDNTALKNSVQMTV